MINIHFVPHSESEQSVYIGSVRCGYRPCGSIYQEVDGYWVYDSGEGKGYMPQWFLETLALKLKDLNDPWDQEIEKYFQNESKEVF